LLHRIAVEPRRSSSYQVPVEHHIAAEPAGPFERQAAAEHQVETEPFAELNCRILGLLPAFVQQPAETDQQLAGLPQIFVERPAGKCLRAEYQTQARSQLVVDAYPPSFEQRQTFGLRPASKRQRFAARLQTSFEHLAAKCLPFVGKIRVRLPLFAAASLQCFELRQTFEPKPEPLRLQPVGLRQIFVEQFDPAY
jgi:hypothetical protein